MIFDARIACKTNKTNAHNYLPINNQVPILKKSESLPFVIISHKLKLPTRSCITS